MFAAIVPALAVSAQTTIPLEGSLKSSSGEAVPAATITITDPATNVTRNARSSTTGQFRVLGLSPGRYTVSVRALGYAPAAQNVELIIGQRANLVFMRLLGARHARRSPCPAIPPATAWSSSSRPRRRGARRGGRRVPRAARPVRRGRHDPGAAGDGRPALRRGRRAGQRRGHGQGVHEEAARRRRAGGRRPRRCCAPAAPTLTACASATAGAAGVRQAGPCRLVGRHHPGHRLGRRSTTRSPRPARTTRRCWSRPRSSGREIECGVLELPDGDGPGEPARGDPDRRRGAEFYDFDAKYLDDVLRVRHPGQARRRRHRAGAGDGGRGVPRAGLRRGSPASTSSSARTG